MTENDLINSRMNALIKNYSSLEKEQNYHIFILMCLKYFYFSDPGIPFDPELIVNDYITDGKNDGGIDAVFNDPASELNDVIIVQSKFYESSSLKSEDVAAELVKIADTLHNISEHKLHEYDPKMVSAYQNALEQKAEDGKIKIVFFTSFKPRDKRSRNKIEKLPRANFKDYDLEFFFREDIEDQIELVDNGYKYVDYDQLEIDRKGNYLQYDESIIVNISAQSLQELAVRRRNGLLGMNLRYYVRKKDVDTGIENSIKKTPDDFWYKNNGILIVCDDWEIDGKVLKLRQFSIVNGGQTTNRIGNADISRDFYLQCKVVKTRSENKEKFILDIAEATNLQKKVEIADMKANTSEQLSLREKLSREHVYYVLKRGDKVPVKQFSESYESANMKTIGKVALAGILQMPGSARSNPARMFQNEYYYQIYKDANATVLADLLKLDYYYTQFLKTELKKDKGYDQRTVLPMFRNGKTFMLASICFLCKVNSSVFDYDTIIKLTNSEDKLKPEIQKMDGLDRLIRRKVDNEKDLIFTIYSVIGQDVLGYCYESALEKIGDDLNPANYLKADTNYYKDVLKRLWARYKQYDELRNAIDAIFKK